MIYGTLQAAPSISPTDAERERPVRKVLIGVVVLIVVLVAAAYVGPRFIPGDALKADIAAQARAATGRELAIDGDLSFTLLPAPGVSVSGVRLANIEGAHAPDMIRLKSAQIVVALGPLLSGDVEIERIVLDEPVFDLEQLADGRTNWTFTPAAEKGAAAGGGGGAPAEAGPGPSVALNDLVVRNGTVVYRTPTTSEQIDGINGSFAAMSLAGPFRGDGKLVVRGTPAHLRATVGELARDKAIPVNLNVGVGGAEATFAGVLSGYPAAPRLAGDLDGKTDDLGALIATVTKAPPPPALQRAPLAIKGDLTASRDAVALNKLSLVMDDVSATGAANATLGATPGVDLVVNVAQLDVDKLLTKFAPPAAAAAAPGAGDRAGNPASAPSKAGAGAGATAVAPFTLPKGINATVEAKVDAALFHGGVIRQAALAAQLADGELTVSQLTAQLPGSADISLFGTFGAHGGAPTFAGQGEANADDLRGLLAWLGVEVPTVPLDRLRKLALTAKLDGTPQKFNVTDIDLGIDGSRLRGGVAVALGQRLGLGIGLALDHLNIDAYLPPATAATAAPKDGAAPTGGGAPAAKPAPAAAGGTGLAFLNRFDAVLQFKAGTLTYRGKTIQGVNLDGALTAGVLDLRDLSVKNLASAQAKIAGRIEGLPTPKPTVDLNVDVNASQADRLLDMFGATPPFTVGAGRLHGSLKGSTESLALDMTAAALGAELTTKGTVAPSAADPTFDLNLDLRHKDAEAFLSHLSGNAQAARSGGRSEPLHVAATAKGSVAKTAFNATVNVGAASATARGQVAGAGTPQMTGGMALTADHPNLADAVRLFVPDYRPALAQPGPLKLTADLAVDPTTLRIDNLKGKAGPVSFDSTATVALDRPRPRVIAQLSTSEIIVDWFLPAGQVAAKSPQSATAKGAARPSAPAAGERWSRERLDFSALRHIDAEIALAAPAISYTDLKVENPKVVVKLADGTLDLSELSGRAYDGTFKMTGQLVDAEVPLLRYALAIDGANAAKLTGATSQRGHGVMSVLQLLFPVSNVKLVSGTLGAKIDVAARGRSERELIESLGGQGTVSFTNAVAEGVDVCRISKQLGNLNGWQGFLGLVLSAQGGSTHIANYAGRFDIAKGIATLPSQRISADCATIDVDGTVDLPRWLIDVQAHALFPEHPKFPGVIVEQKGPLDAPNSRLVNVNEVQQYIVGQSAGSLLRKLVPQTQQAPAPSGGTTTQPPPQQQPEEQLRGLLKDLLRKR